MNGFTEPLPGLLDDPQFQIGDLPVLTDFQIAPLRDPAPSRHANIPLPLEPVAENVIRSLRNATKVVQVENISEKRRTPTITPADVLSAREAKKPHLAISELLEDSDETDALPIHLPSFISLSVVEKSPIQAPLAIEQGHAQKRLKLDHDVDPVGHEVNRRLPRPAQKEDRQSWPAPLLPAMVTGLHEPPPSAALLPSIDLEGRPTVNRSTSAKIQVKDILLNEDLRSPTPSPGPISIITHSYDLPTNEDRPEVTIVLSKDDMIDQSLSSSTVKDNRSRRVRRRWSHEETKNLWAGVKKYGIGKWKQILDDPAFKFTDRSSVDLKDRYRVCAKDEPNQKPDLQSTTIPQSTTSSICDDQSDAAADRNGHTVVTSESIQNNSSSDVVTGTTQEQKQRRKRRAWTPREDVALIEGVTKHGFQWTIIHDDPELNLGHRRATDLRDRIRNKYPDGYKHAETAPLRSELRKAEKLNNPKVACARPESVTLSIKSTDAILESRSAKVQVQGKAGEKDKDKEKEKEKDKDKDQAGVTLPSLIIDDDMIEWDNRLPPLLEWDDINVD